MTITEYLASINILYKSGRATEHSYRGDLTQLLQSLVTEVDMTNEPKRIECGAPDYIVAKGSIPIGYIEAKDIDVSLDATEKSEQLNRYLKSLNNLILTDYMEFKLFRNGLKTERVENCHLKI